jgi:transcriptional regulator with PAS, ATPase and Fis domain
LRNVIERAVLLAGKDEIRASDLPEHIGRESRTPAIDPSQGLNAAVAGFEQELIRKALRAAGDNRALAARHLKINRTTLLAKMKRLGIG